jgi:hypothetical protein
MAAIHLNGSHTPVVSKLYRYILNNAISLCIFSADKWGFEIFRIPYALYGSKAEWKGIFEKAAAHVSTRLFFTCADKEGMKSNGRGAK